MDVVATCCPEVSPELFNQTYRQRYVSYGMRMIDLFQEAAYEYEEPYGLLKKQFEKGRIVIFDVESTGLDVTQDEVIQIAAIELVNGEYTRSFERFIKPSHSVGDSALVHGFSDDYLNEHGEEAREVFLQFQAFVEGALLIGHNVQYDLKIVIVR
ncbi:MAG: exonuclease domain-containing protein [Thomasclavelia ramosa]